MISVRLHRPRLLVVPFVLGLLFSGGGPVRGHSPDPLVGGTLWAQDQRVEYRWRSGQVPPSWMQAAIKAGAGDSNESRRSRSAYLAYDTAGRSTVAYDEPTGCGPTGAACFSRAGAPGYFTMAFRRQGYLFDWGALRWCQAYTSWPDGCYDAENVALDEFGHAQILGHHVNYSSLSDYRDSVVQALSRAKPRSGYNAHAFARCDVATLQRSYDVTSTSSLISTCLSLDTTLSLSPSTSYVAYRGLVTFRATLHAASRSSYGRLSGNALSGRDVLLQRRPVGTTTWSTVGAMTASSTAGGYALSLNLGTTAEWRALFSDPRDEGLQGSASGADRVTVARCYGAGCPSVDER